MHQAVAGVGGNCHNLAVNSHRPRFTCVGSAENDGVADGDSEDDDADEEPAERLQNRQVDRPHHEDLLVEVARPVVHVVRDQVCDRDGDRAEHDADGEDEAVRTDDHVDQIVADDEAVRGRLVVQDHADQGDEVAGGGTQHHVLSDCDEVLDLGLVPPVADALPEGLLLLDRRGVQDGQVALVLRSALVAYQRCVGVREDRQLGVGVDAGEDFLFFELDFTVGVDHLLVVHVAFGVAGAVDVAVVRGSVVDDAVCEALHDLIGPLPLLVLLDELDDKAAVVLVVAEQEDARSTLLVEVQYVAVELHDGSDDGFTRQDDAVDAEPDVEPVVAEVDDLRFVGLGGRGAVALAVDAAHGIASPIFARARIVVCQTKTMTNSVASRQNAAGTRQSRNTKFHAMRDSGSPLQMSGVFHSRQAKKPATRHTARTTAQLTRTVWPWRFAISAFWTKCCASRKQIASGSRPVASMLTNPPKVNWCGLGLAADTCGLTNLAM